MLGERINSLLWLAFVSCFYIVSESYFSLVLLLTTLVLFALLGAIVFVSKNSVRFEVESPGAVDKHESVNIYVMANNLSLVPIAKLKVTVRIENLLTGQTDEKEIAFAINSKSKEKIPLDVDSTYCGKIIVQLQQMVIYDWLGVFSKRQPLDKEGSLYVLPNRFSVEIHAPKQLMVTTDNPLLPHAQKGDSNQEVIDIREYLLGDDVRQVHWKLTGKFDELIIKEISETSDPTYLILLETSLYGNDGAESPEVHDAALGALFAVSEALLIDDISHTIGWLNHAAGEIQFANIYTSEDLGTCLKTILALKKEHHRESAIGVFLAMNAVASFSHVIYVTTEQSEDFLEGLHIPGNVIILNCKEEDITVSRKRELVFTPENMTDELRKLSI